MDIPDDPLQKYLDGMRLFYFEKYHKAIDMLKSAAEDNNINAILRLAFIYKRGYHNIVEFDSHERRVPDLDMALSYYDIASKNTICLNSKYYAHEQIELINESR